MAPFSPSQGPVVPDDPQTPPTSATSSSGKKKKKKKISKSERKRRKRAREQAEKDAQDDKQVKGKGKDQDKRNDNEEIVNDNNGGQNLTEKNNNKQHIQGGAKREIHESPHKKKISDQAQTPQKNEGGNGKIIDLQACKRIISSSLGVQQSKLGDKNTDAMKLQNTEKQVEGTKNNKTEGMTLTLHTSESSRPLISFVYPKRDKQTMMGKPVSYVHTKARKSHGEGNEHENENEGHNNDQGGRDYVDPKQRAQEEELRGDSIDDILFPKRKNKMKTKTEGRSKGAADEKDDNKDSKLVTKKQTDALQHVPMSPMAENVKEGNADVKGTNLSFEGMQVDSDSDSDDSDWAEGNDEDDQESMSTDQSEGDDEVVSSLSQKRKIEEHSSSEDEDRSELKEELKEAKAKEDIDNEDASESKEAKLLKEDVDKDDASRDKDNASLDTRKDGNSTNGHESESQTKLQAQGMEETNAAPKQRRARSDSLSDPLKTLLSGRTVQDAIQDASGRRPRSNSTDSELKLPKRGLCDERMVVMNYKWDHGVYFQKRVMPRGLINLGNTCFLNSTLQCLVYLPTFCQCVAMLPNQNQLNGSNGGNSNNAGKKKKSNSGLQMTVFLRNLIRRVHGLDGEAKHAPLAPKAIVRSISSLGGGSHRGYKFRPGRQEDAHEFLVHLLGAMNDGELKAAGIDQNKSGWRDRLPIPRLDETTLTHRMFGGYLRSQVRCTKCKFNSNTYDPFMDLSLEVSGKKVHSLHDALSEFTRKETLDAANKWKCGGCKKRVCATKQLTIFRPPLTLCIQLKRFSFGSGFGGFMQYQGFSHFAGKGMGRKGGSKVHKQIEFPATLKLPLSDGRKCEYVLTGVIIHIGGSATSGHYTAFVRRQSKEGKSQWLNMDDSFVEPVTEKTVLRNNDAYVLFYCRKEVKLELPSLPRRSFDTAEDAVKAGEIKSKAKKKSRTEVKETVDTLRSKSIEHKIEEKKPSTEKAEKKIIASKMLVSPLKTEKSLLISESGTKPEEEKSSSAKNDHDTSMLKEDHVIAVDTEASKSLENSTGKKTKDPNVDAPTPMPPAFVSAAERANLPNGSVEKKKKKRKATDVTIDMGSRGKVKVNLGKLKNRKPWKSPASLKSDKDSGNLLGNKSVSGWDDEEEGETDAGNLDKKHKSAMAKEKKLRDTAFKENTQKAKNRKRKMYLNSWDAGLDTGKTKKIKDKLPNWYDEKKPEEKNPFHRIQESLSQMKRGRKGFQNTSMKKRRKLKTEE